MISFNRLFILLMFGFFALGAGCFVLFLHPYDFLFKQKVLFTDGGEIFEMWRKPEVDLYVKVYLFNVTNADDYLAGKADKVIVNEVGPYVYKELLEHKVTKFNDNGTVSAIPKHPLQWVDELSEGRKEDDILYLPHIALLSIANVVAPQSMFTRFGLNNLITMTKSQPLVKMTAKEFMMGYKSNLMTLGNTFMPGWIYFDKLGLIDRMYDFNGDYETIFTGAGDISNAGLIDTYKGSTDLPQWDGKHCSNVQYASDGTKFKGGVGKNESVLFFRKNLCRAAPLVPVAEGVKSGLKSYMYTFPENLFDNGKHVKENQCFCRKGKCLPAGLLDVTDCYYGFPIALSYPHFYKGDEVLSSKVEGLTPSKEKHETRFWLQPESGLPIDVSAKIQINMALGDLSSITNAGRFSNMYLPLLWFDIRMYSLPESMETRFKLYLNILPVVEQACMYIFFILGVFFILLTVYRLAFNVMFKSFDKSKKQRNIIIGTDLWFEKENNAKHKSEKDEIYTPCEIPLGDDSESDENLQLHYDGRRPSGFIKIHGDRIKELSHKLGDRVYDSIGSVKDKVRDELTHVKHIFQDVSSRKNSLIPATHETASNDAYKDDSNSESEMKSNNQQIYSRVAQSDSEDDFKYLDIEVVDDGSGFDDLTARLKIECERANKLKELDAEQRTKDELVHISD
ncbi:hypothetical protein JYU34_021976 [Plutella xylostella]|uniref:Scavenger receptor class B member 1 n=1 Tax=Plutella xylostella TaxID=51655 RepID=A0ABQ7PRU2_PLUXY|nr:scavenger receptor class B member 1 isoform X3 [Plutella xylostella]XP_048488059.1 scavenger receptor class B member 1 isoform X2 [Plutella xylostella]KAG7295692.1 hypothetical protein JYU34_021976 [Plutella xylostella]